MSERRGGRGGRRPRRAPRVSDDAVRAVIVRLCREAGEEGRVRPEDVAMALDAEDWQRLTGRIRLTARQLAHEERVRILRKGKVADPDDFKGVYRLRIGPRGWDEEEDGGASRDGEGGEESRA